MSKNTQLASFPNSIYRDSNGNIGIGTSSPLTLLDVKQSATGSATVNSAFRDSSTNGNALQIWNGNNEARFRAVYYGTPSDQNITFYTITSGGSEGERMRITSTGNVGIGTASPPNYSGYTVLALNNATNGGVIDFQTNGTRTATINNDTANFNIGTITSYPFLFYTSGLERMRITSAGNVGIGTGNPSDKLNVIVTSNGNNARFDGPTSGLILQTNASSADIIAYGGITPAYRALNFSTSASTNMTITTGGNVGIGLTSPTGQLSIANQISNGANPVSSYAATNGVNGQNFFNGYYSSNSDALGPYPRWFDIVSVGSPDGSNGGSNIRFFTNPVATSSPAVERMRISSNGNVGIGVGPNSTINATLVIAKDQTFQNDVNPASLILCGVSDTNKRISMGYDTTNNYGWLVAGQYGVQWTSLYLQKVGGAAYAGSARIDNNSDIRVKDNIQQLTGALDKVLAMNGKKFHMLDEPEDKIRLGFIAQELEGVVDELVIHSDRTQKLPNGDVVENVLGLETWGSSWAALLVEAIKEQQMQIEQLKQLTNK